MDGPREYCAQRQMLYDVNYIWNLKTNTDESIHKIEKDTESKLLVTKERERQFRGMRVTYTSYYIQNR